MTEPRWKQKDDERQAALSQCPKCGEQMTEVHEVVTGVCPTHGIQHAKAAVSQERPS